jgi:hypothetical protein
MYKKVLMLGLVASMSAQAMYRGQELQVVVKTPVAQAIRWLSSGRPEANVAAGAIAASVVYSGVSLVTWPYRAWSSRSDRRVCAEQLRVIADQVKNNSDQISGMNGGLVVDKSSLTLEQIVAKVTTNKNFLENLKTLQESNVPLVPISTDSISSLQFNGLTERVAALEEWKKIVSGRFNDNDKEATAVQPEIAVLLARIVALENKSQQQVVQSVVPASAFDGRLLAVEGQVQEHTTQIVSATKKADNAYHLTQKVDTLESDVQTLVSQVKQLQAKVFPANKQ